MSELTIPSDIDPIAYNNYLLSYNISLLSSYPIQQYQNIITENERLKKDNCIMFEDIKYFKNKINDLELTLSFFKKDKVIDRDTKRQKIENKYKINIYKITPQSYSFDEVNDILKNIKSIDDIIKLQNNWFKLRHNLILSKLHMLIPALIELNNMVGLVDIKKDIFKKIIYYIQNPHNDEYLHTVLAGPPGVGKTEFSKIYADIFLRLGILKNDNFISVKRSDLVGQYLGQTSHLTKDLLEKAIGGVLFIDEAYSLGNSEKKDSFSKECIDMINQYLSEKKNEFMCIIAGYEEELEKCFFAYNRGLERRFQNKYILKEYNAEELKEIFIRKVKQNNFKLNIINNDLNDFFYKNKDLFKNYGGDIEKFINEIKYNQCLRTFNENLSNKDIIIDDLILSLNKFIIKNDNILPNMYI